MTPVFVELFSGSGDISKAVSVSGFATFSVDIDERCFCDLHADVYSLIGDQLDFSPLLEAVRKKYPYGYIAFIWASPDCSTYSIAAGSRNRFRGGAPRTEYGKSCDLDNARFFNALWRCHIPYIVENPKGFMRSMDFTNRYLPYRCSVFYGDYGAPYRKPEDLWSNQFGFSAFFRCHYKGCTDYPPSVNLKSVKVSVKAASRSVGRSSIPSGFIRDLIYFYLFGILGGLKYGSA